MITPGPWRSVGPRVVYGDGALITICTCRSDGAMGLGDAQATEHAKAIAQFPDLLAENARLRTEVTQLQAMAGDGLERGLRAEVERLEARLRDTAQILVGAVGAYGPCDAEDAARRAVVEVERLRDALKEIGEVDCGYEDIPSRHHDHCCPCAARAAWRGKT